MVDYISAWQILYVAGDQPKKCNMLPPWQLLYTIDDRNKQRCKNRTTTSQHRHQHRQHHDSGRGEGLCKCQYWNWVEVWFFVLCNLVNWIKMFISARFEWLSLLFLLFCRHCWCCCRCSLLMRLLKIIQLHNHALCVYEMLKMLYNWGFDY